MPAIAIRSITPRMNFARVRLTGEITRSPQPAGPRGAETAVRFAIDDGTGPATVWLSDAAPALRNAPLAQPLLELDTRRWACTFTEMHVVLME